MDQIKIGQFVAQRRKNVKLTQAQLAEKLGITDKAVSKWERGLTMPDVSIMQDLCDILGITVNDLISGEIITMENYNQQLENNLIEMVKEKEKADKRLLSLEVFIGISATVTFLALVFIAAFIEMEAWIRITLIVLGFVLFIVGCLCALRIEQVAGYYQCKKCGHKHVPTFKAVNLAAHLGRTRYLRCPNCHKKSWQKKVISKD